MRWVLAALAGGLWGLCFGRVAMPWAAGVALVPLVLLLGGRRPAGIAFVHGVAFWLASIYWIAPTLEVFGRLPGWLAAICLVLAAVYLALYQAVFGWLAGPVWRAGGWLAGLGVPALWVAVEWLRTYLLDGFPWNLAAYAWTELPGVLPSSAWLGAYGVSALLLLVNVAWALTVVERRARLGVVATLAAALLLAVGARSTVGGDSDRSPPAGYPVRLLQPNISNLASWDPERAAANYRKVVAQSERACDGSGPLLIWPESAVWPHTYGRHEFLRHQLAAFGGRGCPVLFNTVVESGERYFNSVMLAAGGGIAGRYDKQHLVPFGEYVPFGEALPFLKRVARSAGDFSPGEGAGLLPWRGTRLAAAICFEVIFPAEVAAKVRQGAGLLVTVTNDAWYGDTSAPWQHFRAARFRAAENRRYMLRAAITGISAVIAPDGSVRSQLGVGEEGTLAGEVAPRSDRTLFTRAPWLVPALCCLVAAFAIFRSRGRHFE